MYVCVLPLLLFIFNGIQDAACRLVANSDSDKNILMDSSFCMHDGGAATAVANKERPRRMTTLYDGQTCSYDCHDWDCYSCFVRATYGTGTPEKAKYNSSIHILHILSSLFVCRGGRYLDVRALTPF